MQDLPQNQPPYPPSEIYLPEQSQAFEQLAEITQPHALVREILVYPNRGQAILRTAICAVGLVVLLALGAALLGLALASSLFQTGASALPLVVVLVSVLAVYLACFALVAWLTWRMAQLLFSHKPVLSINREGITVSRMPMLSSFFIPWTEIEAIYAYTFMYKYLCIRPKNAKQFLSRFNVFERFNRLSNSIFGIPPLIVPQVFLNTPVEEIIQRLYYMYANELNYYHVQLRS